MDISGLATTDSNGKRVFLLSEFLCFSSPTSIHFQQPINVVATPQSTAPCFLTVTHSLVNTGPLNAATDVEITVFTWDANGAAAPNVTFDWRCRVDIPNIIL
jgi:hypothetical protein